MGTTDAIVVFIMCGSEDEATRVSEALLERRLAACVNRVPGVSSSFWWQGARDAAEELLLIAKSRRELWPQLLACVREHHSYEVFEAIALPVIEGNPDYLEWIRDSTTSVPSS
jgi:periplasmic divalent cation tolerance protein